MPHFVSAPLDARLLVPLFNVFQTVGRFLVLIVSFVSSKDLTLVLVLIIGIVYIVILSLLSSPVISQLSNASFVLALLFSVVYGAMWTCNGSIIFFSAISDRNRFLVLALFVFPVSGLGPILMNLLLGFLYEDYGNFHVSFIVLTALSGVMVLLTLLLMWLTYRKK
jgi:hypothetical protein